MDILFDPRVEATIVSGGELTVSPPAWFSHGHTLKKSVYMLL